MFKKLGGLGGRRRLLIALTLSLSGAALLMFAPFSHALNATVWDSSAVPTVTSADDGSSVELGVKFRSSVSGNVTGISFYKGSGNTGIHTGSLWSSTGSLLATATFTNETDSGWQHVDFAGPVAITANTTYIASYHAPVGHYSDDNSFFASKSVTNGPLTVLQDGTDGGNGVFAYADSATFPSGTYQASNYWVEPTFSYGDSADATPPTVTSVSPAANSSNIATNTTIKAVFSESLDPASVAGSVTVSDSTGKTVSGTTTYDDASKTITFTPGAALTTSSSYTVTINTGVKDVAGNALAAPYSWSFTTISSQTTAVSLWAPAAQTVSTDTTDTSSVELGTKFYADTNGSITALQFYKSFNDASQHTLRLWDSNGNLLASATTSNETASGWQTATLASAQPITAGTIYTVSYGATTGDYSYTSGSLTSDFTNGVLHVPASGGVYTYNVGSLPTNSYNNTNYWVDVAYVASPTSSDVTPPTVSSVSPSNNAGAVLSTTNVLATFSEALNAMSTSGSLSLQDASGTTVAGSTSYDGTNRTITFHPSASLNASTTYTATVNTAVTDLAGNHLAQAYSWSFTTAAANNTDLTKGAGGPILVLSSSNNPFSNYYAEILRTEGLNSFTTADISTATSTLLSKYQVIILGDEALTSAQVTLLTSWVNNGGNLIAMHPDKQLASLLGLTSQNKTMADSYLGIDTTQAPGYGITNQTIQYHGSADEYTMSSSTRAIAKLYSSASATTSFPAVTMRSVGSKGGQAAAFTYDLARSVVLTHQGNPAWSGQDRDGNGVIRPDDLYYGNSTTDPEPDYVDLNKVAIPQADEQQRLLANMIEYMNQDKNPLPKTWYFPNDKKAVMVLASDDHATASGTQDFFNYLLAQSPAGCSVADWTCYRATSLMYTDGPMSSGEAANFESQGFDIGVHVSTNCSDWTPTSLDQAFQNDISTFRAKYTDLPPQQVSRTHCVAWSDYVSTPNIERKYGIRADLNYYYWPGSWVQNRPGYFTGSGMDMRFANTDGSMIDVYQLPSHLVNESGQTWPTNINTMLDRALGPEGYYGVLGTHFDYSDSFGTQLAQAAIAHNVPIVSVQQMINWTDGRNASSFGTPTWSGSTLSFTATADTRTNGMLRGMLPIVSSKGILTSISQSGTNVSFTPETIKGINYAIFPVSTGSYSANYQPDTTAPTVTSFSPASGATGVVTSVKPTITFSEAMDPSTITASNLTLSDNTGKAMSVSVSYDSTSRVATLQPAASLSASTSYSIKVSTAVTDLVGNHLAAAATSSFTTGAATYSLWAPAVQSVSAATNDTSYLELGTQFSSDIAGKITGITFYKSVNDATSHTVTLWDSNGTALATAQTHNETATGWQTASLATPVSITAGSRYTASYTAPTGQYSYTSASLSGGFTNGHLSVPANGGVFSSGGGFPTNSYNSTNYWVDVVMTP